MPTKDNNKAISPAQLKKVQTMFSKLGFDPDDKKGIIHNLTRGRATSTKDITSGEAVILINYLMGKNLSDDEYRQNCLKVVSSIYRIAFDIGMCYSDTPEDKQMNIAKINKFCRERGTVKKNVYEMSFDELRKTKKQFEAMLQSNLDSAVKQLVKKSINPKVKKV